MILVPFLGLFMAYDSNTVIDDFGNQYDFESLILMDDPPLVISGEAMHSAWRFEFDGLDEFTRLDSRIANLLWGSGNRDRDPGNVK